jgi:hypothetical protein
MITTIAVGITSTLWIGALVGLPVAAFYEGR